MRHGALPRVHRACRRLPTRSCVTPIDSIGSSAITTISATPAGAKIQKAWLATGAGEVVHYIARHGESRVSKAPIICAVPPLMMQTPVGLSPDPESSAHPQFDE
jgi:hypothetical protein